MKKSETKHRKDDEVDEDVKRAIACLGDGVLELVLAFASSNSQVPNVHTYARDRVLPILDPVLFN